MKDKPKYKIIGLIPAAGFGNRISPIPCSKELFPIGFSESENKVGSTPRVVSSYLLEAMKYAGVEQILFVIREGKWDIPSYYLNGNELDLAVAYVVVEKTQGAPFTIGKAIPFCKEKDIVFGFPDIIFQPQNALKIMVKKKLNTRADIVLGLFEANNPEKVDMVEFSESGQIKNIVIKPVNSDLTYTWLLAVWSPAFTKFMHEFVSAYASNFKNQKGSEREEIYFGNVIQRAIEYGYNVESVKFPNGSYIDIGTKEDLKKAMKLYIC